MVKLVTSCTMYGLAVGRLPYTEEGWVRLPLHSKEPCRPGQIHYPLLIVSSRRRHEYLNRIGLSVYVDLDADWFGQE